MRALLVLSVLALGACGGGATDTKATRYNFAVVDGANQSSVAGQAALAKPITAELTRDPNGKFATRGVFDFLKPSVAYAEGLTLAGDPVPNQIVCGRESADGEPKVVPLCAYTLADGTVANTVIGGTKAGTYNILFTAQVPSENPVVDSTTVTVDAGPMASHLFIHGNGFLCWTVFPAVNVLDQYGNAVPYRFVTKGPLAHPASDVIGTAEARTLVADRLSEQATLNTPEESQVVDVEVSSGVIASGKLWVRHDGCSDLGF